MSFIVFLQLGTIHSTYEAIDHMSKSTGGSGGIVMNIASVFGLDPLYSAPSYGASKRGVIALMQSLGVCGFLCTHFICNHK